MLGYIQNLCMARLHTVDLYVRLHTTPMYDMVTQICVLWFHTTLMYGVDTHNKSVW